jgi:hypothetical protein
MRLRNIRRAFARLLDKTTDRKIAELRKRAGECESAFRKLNDRIPEMNAASVAAGGDAVQLALVLRAMAANHLASSAVLSEWANVVESASKLVTAR